MTLLPAVAPVISGLSILDFITISPLSLERIFVFSIGLRLENFLFQFKTYQLCLCCRSCPINMLDFSISWQEISQIV